MNDLQNGEPKKTQKFKTQNEKDNYGWAFIDFFIIFLKWKMKRKVWWVFLLLFIIISKK
jgi:hypothetical protein